MKLKTIIILIFFSPLIAWTQLPALQYYQFFDKVDTTQMYIPYQIDTANALWQVGSPQKTLFNSARSAPNAIVTDTMNYYPSNKNSSFQIKVPPITRILTWKQKIDIEYRKDWAIIEFSTPTDSTWKNIFTSPYIDTYKDETIFTLDTMPNGELAFTGIDTNWRYIRVNFDPIEYDDDIYVRYTFVSDSSDTQQEGWMIDNFVSSDYISVKEFYLSNMYQLTPSLTRSHFTVETKDSKEFQQVESIEIITINGIILTQQKDQTLPLTIDLSNYSNGIYFVRILSNNHSSVHPILLQKD